MTLLNLSILCKMRRYQILQLFILYLSPLSLLSYQQNLILYWTLIFWTWNIHLPRIPCSRYGNHLMFFWTIKYRQDKGLTKAFVKGRYSIKMPFFSLTLLPLFLPRYKAEGRTANFFPWGNEHGEKGQNFKNGRKKIWKNPHVVSNTDTLPKYT